MMTDLERAYKALRAKGQLYKNLFAYYDGDQPVMYTARRLEEIFRGLDAVFTENWCAVVIDSAKDRINLRGFQLAAQQDLLDRLVADNELLLESDDVHEAALITGEAFVIVWPDEDRQPQMYYNDPRLCHIFYDAENPRLVSFAAKWWVVDNGTMRMTLYYPDRLEYYATTKKAESVTSVTAFIPMDPPAAPNPYGRVPVFHFRIDRRAVKGDLKSVIPVQNGINKLLADMLVAAEYGAFKQRWIISNADVQGKLKNAPNEIWDIPAGDGMGQQSSVGEFSATDLANYLNAIDNLAMAIAAIARVPKHYFVGQAGDPSGEALIAMEAPLNKKCQDRIDRFIPVWQQVAAFMLEIAGVSVGAQDITPLFDLPATVQPRTSAEITNIRVGSGVPLKTALTWEGKTEAEIEQFETDKADEQSSQQANLARALLSAERQFNAGGQPTNEVANAEPG